jgi:hypothetical protein
MTTSVTEKQGNGGGRGAPERQLGILLACFDKPDGAGKARGSLDGKLRATGDVILEAAIVDVDEKRKASIHEPSRMLLGILLPGLIWGGLGLLAGGWKGAAIWAPLGLVGGWWYTRYKENRATKGQLSRIGKALPAKSSALLTFAETSDPRGVLQALADQSPTSASIAAIDADLTARVFAGTDTPLEVSRSSGQDPGAGPDLDSYEKTVLDSMIMIRYPNVGGAKQVAHELKASKTKAAAAAEVELLIETEENGHRHVTDPTLGTGSQAVKSAISWAVFGAAVGAISGAFAGGNGIVDGIVKGGVVTGLGWAVGGILMGLAYGFFVGRGTGMSKLNGIEPLLAPGTSTVLAWTDGPVSRETLDLLTKDQPRPDQLVLHFNPAEHGAVLAAP